MWAYGPRCYTVRLPELVLLSWTGKKNFSPFLNNRCLFKAQMNCLTDRIRRTEPTFFVTRTTGSLQHTITKYAINWQSLIQLLFSFSNSSHRLSRINNNLLIIYSNKIINWNRLSNSRSIGKMTKKDWNLIQAVAVAHGTGLEWNDAVPWKWKRVDFSCKFHLFSETLRQQVSRVGSQTLPLLLLGQEGDPATAQVPIQVMIFVYSIHGFRPSFLFLAPGKVSNTLVCKWPSLSCYCCRSVYFSWASYYQFLDIRLSCIVG